MNTRAASSRSSVKSTAVAISVFEQAMQRVKLAPRSRSSPPCVVRSSPRLVAPLVAGVPASLRGILGSNQITHSFPIDRHCEPGEVISDDTLRLVSMDNGRYRLVLSPELGGRILSLVDRQAGGELLYQPPMILSRTIGLAGAWHVGGIEINAFRYGHLMAGQSRLKTTAVRLASGYDAVQFQGFDERAECSFTCILALLPDRLAMRVTLANHSAKPQSGYYWTNIAVPANPWTQLYYPPGPMLNHGQGRPGFTDNIWPNVDGFDCRRWLMHHEIMSAYSYKPQGDWMGNCDRRTGLTFAHRALRADHAGRKLWSLGSGDQDRVWFDHAVGEPAMGSYIEIQSGRLATQTHADLIAPGDSISWTEECVGVINHPTDSDSTSEYGAFVKTIEATLDVRIPVRDPAFWQVVEAGKLLVEPDERMSLSERIVTKSGPISSAELRKAAKQGWVAGAGWIAALEAASAAGKGDAWTELAAAVAASDLNAACDKRLEALSRRRDPVGAWASYVRALYVDSKRALPLLRRAVTLAPRERTILFAYANHLLAVRDLRAAQKIATSVGMRGSEDARVILAEVAFLSSKWQECRDILEAPFLAQGEGQFRMYLMRKEVDIVEALTVYRDKGDAERALALLHEACRLRPQFGLGRDEAYQSADAMFYRWAILALSGRTESATLAANQLSQYPAALAPNALGSSIGAYGVRLAVLTKAPDAKARIEACVAWGKDAANDPRPSLTGKKKTVRATGPWYEGGIAVEDVSPGMREEWTLRRCVLRAAAGRAQAFADLTDNRLLGFRARLEAWLAKKLTAGLAR